MAVTEDLVAAGVPVLTGSEQVSPDGNWVWAPNLNRWVGIATIGEGASAIRVAGWNELLTPEQRSLVSRSASQGAGTPNLRGQPVSTGPITGEAPGAAATTPTTQDQADANALILSILRSYGLESLADWAWNMILQGATPAAIEIELYGQKAFQDRFPGIFERMRRGLTPISPAEYIGYENSVVQMFRAAGLPAGFYDDPADFASFIGRNVSIAELNRRINEGVVAAFTAPREVRDELQRLYGIDSGGLTAYFLDPDRALPVLQRQFAAAEIGGASARAQFGFLERPEAESIAALGFGAREAEQVFSQLRESRELFSPLPGEEAVLDPFERGDILGAGFTLGPQREELERRRRQRLATWQGGGGFAAGKEGLSGLGEATQ